MEAIEEMGIATLDFLPNGFAIERYLHPFTAYFVLPVFALFNAGIRLDGRIQARRSSSRSAWASSSASSSASRSASRSPPGSP